jgi:hypothetical protein
MLNVSRQVAKSQRPLESPHNVKNSTNKVSTFANPENPLILES